jgi:hypothetical protein
MKRLLWGTVVALLATGVTLNAQAQGQHVQNTGNSLSGSVHVTFSKGDVGIIREYYAPRYRALPPGLRKKYARTGQLPPGWQKRFQPFEPALERQLVVLPAGYRRGIIDGQAVILDARTHVVIDVAAVF